MKKYTKKDLEKIKEKCKLIRGCEDCPHYGLEYGQNSYNVYHCDLVKEIRGYLPFMHISSPGNWNDGVMEEILQKIALKNIGILK